MANYNFRSEEGYTPLDASNVGNDSTVPGDSVADALDNLASSGGGSPLFALEGHLGPGTDADTGGASVFTQFLGRPTGLGPPPTPDGATQAAVIEGSPGDTFGTPIPNNRARAQFRLADVPVGTAFTGALFVKVAGANAPTIASVTAAAAVADAVDPTIVNVDVTIDGAFLPVDDTTTVYALVLTEAAGDMRSAFCGHIAAVASGA